MSQEHGVIIANGEIGENDESGENTFKLESLLCGTFFHSRFTIYELPEGCGPLEDSYGVVEGRRNGVSTASGSDRVSALVAAPRLLQILLPLASQGSQSLALVNTSAASQLF
jgi:hypothetical protein